MKLRIIYTFFALSLGAFVFFGNADGRAASQGMGNTGAPGDEVLGNGTSRTCQTCHNNGSFSPSLAWTMTDAGGTAIGATYTPGETYDVKLIINGASAAAYGFQAVALEADLNVDGASINTWSAVSGNAQVAVASNGRQYAEQNGASTSNEFDMQWVAPAAGSGPVSIYYCGNAVNLMSGTNGDNAVCASLVLADGTASINDPNANVALDIFPNPVNNIMHLKTIAQRANSYTMMIYDQSGKMVMTQNLEITAGEKINFVDVANLSSGHYTLLLNDENGEAVSKKIIKQ